MGQISTGTEGNNDALLAAVACAREKGDATIKLGCCVMEFATR
jgi:hypothetical protein